MHIPLKIKTRCLGKDEVNQVCYLPLRTWSLFGEMSTRVKVSRVGAFLGCHFLLAHIFQEPVPFPWKTEDALNEPHSLCFMWLQHAHVVSNVTQCLGDDLHAAFVSSSWSTGSQVWVLLLLWCFLVRGLSRLRNYAFHLHCSLPAGRFWVGRPPSVYRQVEMAGGHIPL